MPTNDLAGLTNDLAALIRSHCAERINSGKAPTRAMLAWLDAVPEHAPQSSVALIRNAKGDIQFEVKAYHADPVAAKAIAVQLTDELRRTFPMKDGTVGSPMRGAGTEPPLKVRPGVIQGKVSS